jgi:dipeptidyl aminopeptidase/acylaminoacyl peptidase
MRGVCRIVRGSVACLGLVGLACLINVSSTPARQGVAQAPTPRVVGQPAPAPAEPGQMAVLTKEAYLTPPKVIADAVLAARGENITLNNLSPDGRKFLIAKRDGLPSLDRLGCPCVYLAERAFDHVALRDRSVWVQSAEALDLFFPAENRTVPVQVPRGARVGNTAWSPDGSKLAFLALFPDATHVCIADTETGACRKLTNTPVLATMVTALQWTTDGKQIQTVLLPDDGKRPVPQQIVANEPIVRVTRDGKNPSRTYRYLLESPYEMQLLEHLLTGQLALINVADGAVTRVGEPAMIRSVSGAPDGSQFRVGLVKKPFSYHVPFTSFGSMESIWDREGKSLFTLSDRNLRDRTEPVATAPTTPKGGGKGGFAKGGGKGPAQPPVDPTDPTDPKRPTDPDDQPNVAPEPFDPEGKRDLSWRPDGKGLSFLQMEPAKKNEQAKDAKDAKDAKQDAKVVRNDRVMQWLPPYGQDDVKVVYESPNRISAVQYSEDCRWLFLAQTVGGQRQVSAIDLTDPKTVHVIDKGPATGGFGGGKKGDAGPKKGGKDGDDDDLDDDADEQPGGIRAGAAGAGGVGLMTRSLGGANVVRISGGGDVYITGTERGRGDGSFARPYLDAINIKTGQRTRVFEGKGDMLETIDGVDGNDIKRVFTTRQKSNVVPDSYMTELETGKVTKLTNNVDKTPWFHDLKVERFRVTRVDGFRFWVKVTTPPNATGKLPALFWIYPREYTDQAAYDAGAGKGGAGGPGAGTGRFNSPGPRSMAILTLLGYAVVEPDIPIVGPAGRMNDNYIPDLRNSLWAVIDELDKRGTIDRDRLACGGHSYGAFSTANAMAHTPFFKAGIAGDGCYNRTLTTMSFQTERRQLWDARETYLEMSPLLWANRVNGALLMYHGMEDANVGTHPINSELLFLALDGLGKDAAMYMYPYEGHGPLAKETTLDMWARWVAWLDLYVMNPTKK